MADDIDFYYWPTPNGWKIAIALEEFGLPYRTHLINISQDEQFAPEFLRIAPNNKMPAIVDPQGPDGASLALFESGAILQYLARKTGQFGGATPREQAEVEQWLMWQMGGVGPMAGQTHHFLKYAPEDLPYAKARYTNEVARLYSVLDRRLADRAYVAGDSYTIADMAIWPWASLWQGQDQTLYDKPHLARWLKSLWERPALRKGRSLHADLRKDRSDTWVTNDLFPE